MLTDSAARTTGIDVGLDTRMPLALQITEHCMGSMPVMQEGEEHCSTDADVCSS